MSSRIEEMDDHELLKTLVKSQKRATLISQLTAVINMVLLILLVGTIGIFLPKTIQTLNQADQTLKDISAITDQAEASIDEIDRMVANVNSLVEENTEELSSAISGISESTKKLQDIDIDSLNDSIQNLAKVLGPLSKFGGFLNGT